MPFKIPINLNILFETRPSLILLIIGIPALIACLVYRRYVQNKEREIQYARLKDMRKETNDFMNENEVK